MHRRPSPLQWYIISSSLKMPSCPRVSSTWPARMCPPSGINTHISLSLSLSFARSLDRSLSLSLALCHARARSLSLYTHTPHTHRPLFARPPCQSICTNNEHALSLHTRSLSIAAHTHGASLDTRACSGVFVCERERERRFPLTLSWHMGQLLPLPPSLLSQCPCVCM
jgi:hypothetical protein